MFSIFRLDYKKLNNYYQLIMITRTFDLLDRYAGHFMQDNVLNSKVNGQWKGCSAEEYIRLSHAFAYGLMALGLKKGDKIISVSNNRPEWNFIDMGMAMTGVVHVPVFTSLSVKEYTYICDHSGAKFIIVSDRALSDKLLDAAKLAEGEFEIYSFNKIEGVKNWEEIILAGESNKDKYYGELEAIKKEIREDDFASLIYTSGTTGAAKGVMLSHKNMVQNAMAAAKVFGLGPGNKYLSILPLCHVGGRMGNYQTQYSGCPIYYAENMGSIAADMKEIRPHGFDTVPRILEKIFDNVIAKGNKLKGMKKALFFWAVRLGLRYKHPLDSSWLYKKKLALADKLIFSKWREALGGNIQLAGCGGASLQPRLERVFWASGIQVINMYGLTETSPVITINRRTKPLLKLGSVGALIDGVELKIARDGEILCRGHNVMLGYYKDPQLTSAAFSEDGWFHTGDIGRLSEDKFLEITDRKKEIFKLSSGKFIAPQLIEGKLKESVFIEQAMVVGEHEKFASALISINISYVDDWLRTQGIKAEGDDRTRLNEHPRVKEIFKAEVDKINKDLSQHERILRFRLINESWSPDAGELSPTLKLRRKFIFEKYREEIEMIYGKQQAL